MHKDEVPLDKVEAITTAVLAYLDTKGPSYYCKKHGFSLDIGDIVYEAGVQPPERYMATVYGVSDSGSVPLAYLTINPDLTWNTGMVDPSHLKTMFGAKMKALEDDDMTREEAIRYHSSIDALTGYQAEERIFLVAKMIESLPEGFAVDSYLDIQISGLESAVNINALYHDDMHGLYRDMADSLCSLYRDVMKTNDIHEKFLHLRDCASGLPEKLILDINNYLGQGITIKDRIICRFYPFVIRLLNANLKHANASIEDTRKDINDMLASMQ